MKTHHRKKNKRRRIRPVTGIRRKIGYGFVILGFLLLFAGGVSYVQLSRLSRFTDELISSGLRDLDYSDRMLQAVAQQDEALYLKIHRPAADSINAD